jgi:serralysin
VIGAAAQDAQDRIIYNSATGALLYDSDGVGGAAAVQFAELSAGLALTNLDFLVV